MSASAKALAKGLCPPFLWSVARRVCGRDVSPPAPTPAPIPPRLVSTTDEIDAEIKRALAALDVSADAHFGVLASFQLKYPVDLPADPDSAEYREAQLQLYRRLTGRNEYHPAIDEATPFEAHHAEFPFPYYTHSCVVVGQQLIGVGFLIHSLGLSRGGRILEIGSGYGKTTIELAQMGFDVTALDVYAPFLDLVRRRCAALGHDIKTVCSDMLDYRPTKRFDRVIFSASFHHCSDHARMIDRLDQLVAPGGAIFFSCEPVEDDFPAPWGIHPSGQALWCIRNHGWMELGFRTDYFTNLLARYGWNCEIITPPAIPRPRLFIARRAAEAQYQLQSAA